MGANSGWWGVWLASPQFQRHAAMRGVFFWFFFRLRRAFKCGRQLQDQRQRQRPRVCAFAGLGGYGWVCGTRCKYIHVSSRAPSMAPDGPAHPPVPALDSVRVLKEEAGKQSVVKRAAPCAAALAFAMRTNQLSGVGVCGFAGPCTAWMPYTGLHGCIHGVSREPTQPHRAHRFAAHAALEALEALKALKALKALPPHRTHVSNPRRIRATASSNRGTSCV